MTIYFYPLRLPYA